MIAIRGVLQVEVRGYFLAFARVSSQHRSWSGFRIFYASIIKHLATWHQYLSDKFFESVPVMNTTLRKLEAMLVGQLTTHLGPLQELQAAELPVSTIDHCRNCADPCDQGM
jgi:hypothetical protein